MLIQKFWVKCYLLIILSLNAQVEGQITLGRACVETALGAKIDMKKGVITFNSLPGAVHTFPKRIKYGKPKVRVACKGDASSFENT